MRRHPGAGEEVVGNIEALRDIARAVGAEHERWDATRTPGGAAPSRSTMFWAPAVEVLLAERGD